MDGIAHSRYSIRMPRSLLAVACALAALSGCRFHAQPANQLARNDECRAHCAYVHERCVESGQAKNLGLAGVTYDLCRGELESCHEQCGRGAAETEIVQRAPPPSHLAWERGDSSAVCAGAVAHLAIPENVEVRRMGADELRVDLAPDSVLVLRSVKGQPPPLLEEWAHLHAQLTGSKKDELALRVNASSTTTGTWTVEYAVQESGRETSFRAAARSVQRGGDFCRVIAVERSGAAPERSSVRMLRGFSAL